MGLLSFKFPYNYFLSEAASLQSCEYDTAVVGRLESSEGIRTPNLIEGKEMWQEIGYLQSWNKRQPRSNGQI